MNKGKLSRAMEHLDDALLLDVLQEDEGLQKTQHEKRRHTMKTRKWNTWGTIAAMLAVVIASALIFTQLIGANGTAVVALDVNPSIEIQVNGKEEVTKVSALNDDAVIVLGTMDLTGVDLDVAVNAILGSMLTHEYLTESTNSILVSVDSNSRRAEKLQQSISTRIADLLAGQNIQASVITQTYDHDKGAKAQLVEKIIAAGLTDASGTPYTYEQLIGLKVHDLKLILDTKPLNAADMTATGTAGNGNYIGRDAAITKVLTHTGINAADILTAIEVEMDYEDDYRAMVYEVEFIYDGMEYEYELLAADGSIVKEEIKAADIGDRNDADDNIALPDGCITEEDARTIAFTDAGIDAAQAFGVEIETDREWGKYVYEIEFETDTHEYEYLINAQTGKILDSKRESHRR